jgi:hypothetical protein
MKRLRGELNGSRCVKRRPVGSGEINCESLFAVVAMLSLLIAVFGGGCLGVDLWSRYRGANAILVDTAMQEIGIAMIFVGVPSFAICALLSYLSRKIFYRRVGSVLNTRRE